MLLNLDGFQYATSLDLNMGYYHIELPVSEVEAALHSSVSLWEVQDAIITYGTLQQS